MTVPEMSRDFEFGYADGEFDGSAGNAPSPEDYADDATHSRAEYLAGYKEGYRDGKSTREVK